MQLVANEMLLDGYTDKLGTRQRNDLPTGSCETMQKVFRVYKKKFCKSKTGDKHCPERVFLCAFRLQL
jgi:hypothetical protein